MRKHYDGGSDDGRNRTNVLSFRNGMALIRTNRRKHNDKMKQTETGRKKKQKGKKKKTHALMSIKQKGSHVADVYRCFTVTTARM